jgi:hypothetical protein
MAQISARTAAKDSQSSSTMASTAEGLCYAYEGRLALECGYLNC